ncbi:vitamin K epoxide reductase family protein [Candidatus Dojkabacteria bacterium]|nr:vitamin K epoxide reductase family protein [Candidatus Dojkabacteria bacterium]
MSRSKLLKIIILLLSVGVLLSGYLYVSKALNVSVICPNSGCDIVDASPYSYMLGIPVALWGLLYYFGMFVMAMMLFKKESKGLFNLYFLGVIFGISYTVYLRYVEYFKIGAFCVWCWGSVVVMVALAYYSWRLYRQVKGSYNTSDDKQKVSN